MDRKIRLRVASIVAFLFSLCFLVGQSYDKLGSWQLIKESPVLSAVKFCAVLAAAFVIINLLYKTVGFISSNRQVPNHLVKYSNYYFLVTQFSAISSWMSYRRCYETIRAIFHRRTNKSSSYSDNHDRGDVCFTGKGLGQY